LITTSSGLFSTCSKTFDLKLPFIYRIHEQPKEEKMQRFFDFAAVLGILVKEYFACCILLSNIVLITTSSGLFSTCSKTFCKSFGEMFSFVPLT
jgi:hypothetical protein